MSLLHQPGKKCRGEEQAEHRALGSPAFRGGRGGDQCRVEWLAGPVAQEMAVRLAQVVSGRRIWDHGCLWQDRFLGTLAMWLWWYLGHPWVEWVRFRAVRRSL